MSEQPASSARRLETKIMSEAVRVRKVERMGLVLDRDHIGASFGKIENMTHELLLMADRHPGVGQRYFRLAHEEEVDVVRRQRVVERRLDRVSGTDRPHDVR